MHDPADFQNVFQHNVEHYVVAEHAEAHAFAELGTEPSSLWECDQCAAMFAQLLHECNGARGSVPRDVARYLLQIAG